MSGNNFSTASLREPSFPGIAGYIPLPLPMSSDEIKTLPYDVLVSEIRHYLTIVEQKKDWMRRRNSTLRMMKGKQSACAKHQRSSR